MNNVFIMNGFRVVRAQLTARVNVDNCVAMRRLCAWVAMSVRVTGNVLLESLSVTVYS